MKFGVRKPSIKKSIKARTTGRVKRTINKSINPLYGKKGMGWINNPEKALYNKIYNKTSIGVKDMLEKENEARDIKGNNKNAKNFLKYKKNISIIVLVIALLFTIFSSLNNIDIKEHEDIVATLNEKITNKENEIEKLETDNKQLKTEKETLETEKKELERKLEKQAEETEDSAVNNEQTTTSSSTTNNTSVNSNTVNNSTPSNEPVSSITQNDITTQQTSTSSSIQEEQNSQEEMVWVGETGTKYHYQSCRTLKGKGHQITLKQALAEGREACKVCH